MDAETYNIRNTAPIPHMAKKDFEMLLVEDDPDHVVIMREALKDGQPNVKFNLVEDGEKALDYLHRRGRYAARRRPDLVLLDLKLPKKDGREVLDEIKSSEGLRDITVVILTGSDADRHLLKKYGLGANCYVSKPSTFPEFARVVRSIVDFWAR